MGLLDKSHGRGSPGDLLDLLRGRVSCACIQVRLGRRDPRTIKPVPPHPEHSSWVLAGSQNLTAYLPSLDLDTQGRTRGLSREMIVSIQSNPHEFLSLDWSFPANIY